MTTGLLVSLILIVGTIARVFFWFRGKANVKAKIDKKDAEVLKRQRDNNVTSLDDADSAWLRIRNDKQSGSSKSDNSD